jgi:hypothetical protein
MRIAFAMLAIVATVLALVPTEASAWYCRARSPNAWGWGTSPNIGRAKYIALKQCAVRTPRYQTCYISYCR